MAGVARGRVTRERIPKGNVLFSSAQDVDPVMWASVVRALVCVDKYYVAIDF